MLGRGQVWVAHAEIDDVRAAGASLSLELVDLLEDVRRQGGTRGNSLIVIYPATTSIQMRGPAKTLAIAGTA